MRLKHILIGLAVVIVAAVVAVVAILKSLDLNEYKGLIAEEVRKATGRELVLAGDVDIGISLTPRLSVSDVSFSNAEWGTAPHMVKLERLEAVVSLIPLLSGTVQINRIVLVGGDILLETNAAGEPNWVFAGAGASDGASGGGQLPTVHALEIQNSKLTYRDGVTGKVNALGLTSFLASADSLTSPLELAIEGAINENPFTLNGSVGSPQVLLDGGAFPVDLTFEGGGAKATLQGEIAEPLKGKGIALALSIAGESLADLNGLAGAELPPLGPYSLAGNVSDPEGAYKVSNLALTMGTTSLTGEASVAMGGARPNLQANLAATQIDLKDFGIGPSAAAEGEAAEAAPSDGRVIPATPIEVGALGIADATIVVTAQKFIKEPVTLENVALDLTLQDSVLQLNRLAGALGGGNFDMNATVNGAGAVPAIAGKIVARGVEVGTLLQTLGVSDVLSGGAADLDLDISGNGATVRDLMAGLNGSSDLRMGQGHINNSFAKIVLSDLFSLIASGGSEESSNLNCLVSRFSIVNGLATSTALAVDTNGASIVGDGAINLADERLDMRLHPNAKDANLVSVAVPVKIGGTMASPSVVPDAAAMASNLVGLAGDGGAMLGALAGVSGDGQAAPTGGDNACVSAVDTAGSGPAQPAQGVVEGIGAEAGAAVDDAVEATTDAVEGAVDGAGEVIDDAAEGAGEAIENLLGN